MNILLVNDDGYKSENLLLVREQLRRFGKVYIVAPEVVMSGKSIALTIYNKLTVTDRGDDIYSIDGTPADCVAYGLNHLGIKFDLVVSGINYGFNLSYDIAHSGTVGACVEALMFDTPAIALSAEGFYEENAKYVGSAVDFAIKNNLLSLDYFLNVNFPQAPTNKGIKFTQLVYRKDKRYYEINGNVLTPKRDIVMSDNYPEDSDIMAIKNGYISICPCTRNFFSLDLFKKLKEEIKNK